MSPNDLFNALSHLRFRLAKSNGRYAIVPAAELALVLDTLAPRER